MSHFVVIVVGATPDTLEAQMAPFDEGSEDPRFIVFHETEAEYRKEFENNSVDMIQLPDGTRKYTWDESFKRGRPFDGEPVYPEGAVKLSVPHRERFESFEAFMADWVGSDSRDEAHGVYGYFRNPNAKWDWYQIGGRWRGYFHLKPGAQGTVGDAGAFGNKAERGTADVLTLADWDLEGQRAKAGEEAGARYDKFFALLGERPLPPTWVAVRDSHNNIDDARKAYHSHPVMEYLRSQDSDYCFLGFDSCPGTEFGVSREDYMQKARNRVGVPFAVLKDGVWYERGSMGWWGMVSDEKDTEDWAKQVAELFDTLPADTPLIAVDCHI